MCRYVNTYVTGAQDYFDFRIRVRAFKGEGAGSEGDSLNRYTMSAQFLIAG